ncbi:hypothetical protein LNTAR_15322 [Lentisphaera araneosa HTCC2155]|uniref:Uncharacterized protein n=1 Tax=Lentisphaera araneosa HTCC2155 TaxID=313628 RepID=A6DRI9_9BACT|nr:hypothetical protein [Lentisphaera araneosa]EDM25799.1 hypothetical protein LNTAR_15322 [Lentisphaera araneosa HTCC2155]
MGNLLYWEPQIRTTPYINQSFLQSNSFSKIHSATLYACERFVYRLDPQGILSMWSWLILRLGLALLIPLFACWGLVWCISLFASAALAMVTAITQFIVGTLKLIGYIFLTGVVLMCFGLFSNK